MKITITIETGNEAMQTWEDLYSSIGRCIAHRDYKEHDITPGNSSIKDWNGNTVGSMDVFDDSLDTPEDIRAEVERRR